MRALAGWTTEVAVAVAGRQVDNRGRRVGRNASFTVDGNETGCGSG
jgi:hypothetical protein